MVIAVNFHYIRENISSKYPSIHGLTPKEFIDQLEVLSKLGVFLSQSDICNRIENKDNDNRIGIVITFDDGLREQFDFAWDILKKKGIPCIMYINTRPIEEKVGTVTHKIHIIISQVRPNNVQVSDSIHEIGIKALMSGIEKICFTVPYFLKRNIVLMKQNLEIGKVFHRKDFKYTSLIKANANLSNGLMNEYINAKISRDLAYPIYKFDF